MGMKLALWAAGILNWLVGPYLRFVVQWRSPVTTVNAHDTKNIWREVARDVAVEVVPVEVQCARIKAFDLEVVTNGRMASIKVNGVEQPKTQRLVVTFDWQKHPGIVKAEMRQLHLDRSPKPKPIVEPRSRS